MAVHQGDDRSILVLRVFHHLDLHDVLDGEVHADAAPRFVGDDSHAFLVARIRREIVIDERDVFEDVS